VLLDVDAAGEWDARRPVLCLFDIKVKLNTSDDNATVHHNVEPTLILGGGSQASHVNQ